MGIILSAFKGCGKTYLKNVYGDKVKIADLTEEYSEGMDYDKLIDKTMSVVADNDIVFVGCDTSTRNTLNERNIDYDIFYPSIERKNEFLENFVRKHESPNIIRELDRYFDEIVKSIDSEEADCCYKHKLNNFGEFIGNSPVIMQYINSLQNNNLNKKTNEQS